MRGRTAAARREQREARIERHRAHAAARAIEPPETTSRGHPPWPGASRYAVTIEGAGAVLVRRHLWADTARAAAEMIDPVRYRAAEAWRLREETRTVIVRAVRIHPPGDTFSRTFSR